jgi:beta-galactosidase
MELLKVAGGNCVATYIPWLLHEPEEGRFEFQSDDGRLNLEEFLEVANSLDLYVVARPGPYQYSELINAGLPTWLVQQYPQLLAKNIDGESFNAYSVSYLHPLFLEKVQRWFNQVCPIIARHTVSRGGVIAFTQIDNEMTGIHEWFGGLDYNPESMNFGSEDGRYVNFLKGRYRDIASLNSSYETNYVRFVDVRPLKNTGGNSAVEIRRLKDYFDFYLSTVAEYAVILRDMMKANGIDTPFIHNAANPSMNTSFKETVEALGNDFLLGSDHYYNLSQDWAQNNPTPQYAVKTFYSLEILRLMGFPPTVLEMPGISLSDWPPITPIDARACYLTNLALGTKGINYYIFSGGTNPPGAGLTSDVYGSSAPIGAEGEIQPLYPVIKDLGHFLAERPWFSRLTRHYDFRCLLNMEYPRSWRYWSSRGEYQLSNSESHDFLIKGVLSTAFCAGLSPALCNADADDWTSDTDTPLVVVSSVSMSEVIQQKIIRFLNNGGKLLLTPVVPVYDENLRACTVLSDYLEGPKIGQKKNEPVRIDIDEVRNIFNNGEVFETEKLPAGASVIGENVFSGRPLAWSLETPKNGQIIFLGVRWLQAMREHERMLSSLLTRLGLRQKIQSTNPNVWTSLSSVDDRMVLFLMNLFTSPMETHVSVQLDEISGVIDTGMHRVEAMSVKIIELGKGNL